MSSRTPKKYYVNPRRDTQYDAMILSHLEATRLQGGKTYNQIAAALGRADDKARVYAVRDALEAFCQDAESPIVSWYPNLRLSAAVLAKSRAKVDLRLFKHAPIRNLINQRPAQADSLVRGAIRGFLCQSSGCSEHAVIQRMIAEMGYISKAVVRRCLADMIADGQMIMDETAKNNAHIYSLARLWDDETDDVLALILDSPVAGTALDW